MSRALFWGLFALLNVAVFGWRLVVEAEHSATAYARGYAAAVDSVRRSESKPLNMTIGPLDTVTVWREAGGEMRGRVKWNTEPVR